MSLIDPSDPNALFDTIVKLGTNVQQKSGQQLEVANEGAKAIGEINKNLFEGFQIINQQADTEFKKGEEALDNLSNLSRMPPIFRRVMSLFDSSFSRTAQKVELQKSQLRLENLTRKGDILQNMAKARLSTVEAAQDAAKLQTDVAKDQFQNFRDILTSQGTIFENLDKQMQLAVQQTPISELRRFARGDKNAQVPSILKRFPGKIEDLILARAAAEAGLTSTQLGNERSRIENEVLQRDEFLTSMTDQQLDFLKTHPDKLPEGMSPQHIENQILKNKVKTLSVKQSEATLTSTELDVKSKKRTEREAEIANVLSDQDTTVLLRMLEGATPIPNGMSAQDVRREFDFRRGESAKLTKEEIAAQTAVREEGLNVVNDMLENTMNLTELKNIIIQAQDQGLKFVELNGAKVAVGRVEQIFKKRLESEKANPLVMSELDRATADLIVGQTKNKTTRLAQVTNPGTAIDPENPEFNIQGDHVNELQTALTQYGALRQAASVGLEVSREMLDAANAAREAQQKQMDAIVDTFGTKEAGKAVREFINTGAITNNLNAASLLIQEGSNPDRFAGNDILAAPFTAFSEALAEELTKAGERVLNLGGSGRPGPQGDASIGVIDKDAPPDQNIVATAIKNSGFKTKVNARILQRELALAISALHKEMKDEAGFSPYQGIVNENDLSFNRAIAFTDTGAFSPNKLSEFLASRAAKMQADNILEPNQSLMELVLGRVTKNNPNAQTTHSRYFGEDPVAAALANQVFFRDPREPLFQNLRAISTFDQTALQRAMEVVKQTTDREDAAISAIGVNPAVLPQDKKRQLLDSMGMTRDPFTEALIQNTQMPTIAPEQRSTLPLSGPPPEFSAKEIEKRSQELREAVDKLIHGVPFNEVFNMGQKHGGLKTGGARLGAQTPQAQQ